jgi:hypothetical protein
LRRVPAPKEVAPNGEAVDLGESVPAVNLKRDEAGELTVGRRGQAEPVFGSRKRAQRLELTGNLRLRPTVCLKQGSHRGRCLVRVRLQRET